MHYLPTIIQVKYEVIITPGHVVPRSSTLDYVCDAVPYNNTCFYATLTPTLTVAIVPSIKSNQWNTTFIRCPKYTVLRTEMLNSLNLTEPITCQLLIYGDERESYDYNCHIFSCVQSFIVKTKRFI